MVTSSPPPPPPILITPMRPLFIKWCTSSFSTPNMSTAQECAPITRSQIYRTSGCSLLVAQTLDHGCGFIFKDMLEASAPAGIAQRFSSFINNVSARVKDSSRFKKLNLRLKLKIKLTCLSHVSAILCPLSAVQHAKSVDVIKKLVYHLPKDSGKGTPESFTVLFFTRIASMVIFNWRRLSLLPTQNDKTSSIW